MLVRGRALVVLALTAVVAWLPFLIMESAEAEPLAPESVNAYAYFENTEQTVRLGGDPFLDMRVNSGGNLAAGVQNYFTFTNSVLAVGHNLPGGCVLDTNIYYHNQGPFD